MNYGNKDYNRNIIWWVIGAYIIYTLLEFI